MALLKNVEPDIIFRHFVWSVLFIASVAYYINTHIMPNIAIYKEQVRFTRVTQMTLEQNRAVNKDAKSRVQSFSNINHETLQVFGKQINEATLKKYLPKGFLNINVKKTRDEFIKEDQLKKTYFTIYGETESNNLNKEETICQQKRKRLSIFTPRSERSKNLSSSTRRRKKLQNPTTSPFGLTSAEDPTDC